LSSSSGLGDSSSRWGGSNLDETVEWRSPPITIVEEIVELYCHHRVVVTMGNYLQSGRAEMLSREIEEEEFIKIKKVDGKILLLLRTC